MTPDGTLPEQVLYQDADLAPGRTTRLEGSEADHARRSLRLRTGDRVHLVNGRGHRYGGRIVDIGKLYVDVSIESDDTVPEWPRSTLWLGAGVLRSTRMDTLVEKASELGVSRFVPLLLNRSVAKPGGEGSKEDRWHRLAIESLKQSRRARLMEVDAPRTLDGFLKELPPDAELWVADPEGVSPSRLSRSEQGTLGLVVGPEGGLSPREREILVARKAHLVALGRNRLRAETAAISLVTTAIVVRDPLED